ncbi:hypothetical protein ACFO9E_18240 [Streptomyces maoxianensis]|uniref:Protein kilB n=1 Tax=Streptomyces maoxianensis TaxID=1459942 RepID=A0ABV9G9G8_9ACTN
MEPETVAALWGFGGTFVGAGVTLTATAMTLSRQAKEARKAKVEDQARAAGERALGHLYDLRRHLTEAGAPSVPQEHQPWKKIARGHIDAARMAVKLMPGADDLHERVEETLQMGEYLMAIPNGVRQHQAQNLKASATETINIISASMRADPLPNRSNLVRAYQCQLVQDARERAEEPSEITPS